MVHCFSFNLRFLKSPAKSRPCNSVIRQRYTLPSPRARNFATPDAARANESDDGTAWAHPRAHYRGRRGRARWPSAFVPEMSVGLIKLTSATRTVRTCAHMEQHILALSVHADEARC